MVTLCYECNFEDDAIVHGQPAQLLQAVRTSEVGNKEDEVTIFLILPLG